MADLIKEYSLYECDDRENGKLAVRPWRASSSSISDSNAQHSAEAYLPGRYTRSKIALYFDIERGFVYNLLIDT